MFVKYLLEASAIALVSRYFIGKSPLDRGFLVLILSIAAAQLVVDIFAPQVAQGVRQGAGFSLGAKLIGGGMGIQTALGIKRSLSGEPHMAVSQMGGMMDDPMALEYYGNDRQLAPAPAGTAHQYAIYGNLIPTNGSGLRVRPDGSEVAEPEAYANPETEVQRPAPDNVDGDEPHQVNAIERFMDDREALEYYREDRDTKSKK